MSVQLIALDIDGTLLSSRFTVSQRNRAAIAEAPRRGIEVALVTGRRYDFAMPVAKQIDSPLTMIVNRSEEHTSELQSRQYLVCRLLLEKKNNLALVIGIIYCIFFARSIGVPRLSLSYHSVRP